MMRAPKGDCLLDQEAIDFVAGLHFRDQPFRLAAAPGPGLRRIVGVGVLDNNGSALAAAAKQITHAEAGIGDERFHLLAQGRPVPVARGGHRPVDALAELLQLSVGHPLEALGHARLLSGLYRTESLQRGLQTSRLKKGKFRPEYPCCREKQYSR
jgi:hypothetical protein